MNKFIDILTFVKLVLMLLFTIIVLFLNVSIKIKIGFVLITSLVYFVIYLGILSTYNWIIKIFN
jgi:hypothetical protein